MLAARPTEQVVASSGMMRVAVLVPLLARHGHLWVVMVRRPIPVDPGGGLLGFPGLGREAGGPEPAVTVIARAAAEIGLDPRHAIVLGRLSEVITPSHSIVAPVVAALPADFEGSPRGDGVESVVMFPFAYLASPELVEEQVVRAGRRRLLFPVYHYRNHRVAGPTAAIVGDLLDRLSASREEGEAPRRYS
ncbi:MAG: NUDIX domain-containing protein [Acidobacteriota bacterium]